MHTTHVSTLRIASLLIMLFLSTSLPLLAQEQSNGAGEQFVHFFTTPIDTHRAVPAPMREFKDPQGIVYIDYAFGKGDSAADGKRHFIRFLGAHLNGNMFDTSYAGSRLFSFVMGKNEVLKGLEIGIKTMTCGGRRQITIPAALAYGANGYPSVGIGQNEALVFYVELVKVE